MAKAARIPMITTTINSSISVKPRAFKTIPPGAKGRLSEKSPNRRPNCGHYPPFLQEACLTLRVDPILSGADTYDERHPQFANPLHLAFYKTPGRVVVVLSDTKNELVVHLQDHPGVQASLLDSGMDSDHGDLDQVRRRPLERRVRCRTLAEGADTEVAVPQLGDITPASEQGLHESTLARFLHGLVEPGADAGEALEVVFNEGLRLLQRDAELPRQRERPLAIDGRKVDGLRPRPHFRLLAHLSGDPEFVAAFQRGGELRIAGEVSQQAELDLR